MNYQKYPLYKTNIFEFMGVTTCIYAILKIGYRPFGVEYRDWFNCWESQKRGAYWEYKAADFIDLEENQIDKLA